MKLKYDETVKWFQVISTLDNVNWLIQNFVRSNRPESYDVVGITPQLGAPGCVITIAYIVKEEKTIAYIVKEEKKRIE